MKRALVVGGNSGVGLAVVINLIKRQYDHICIVGHKEPDYDAIKGISVDLFKERTSFIKVNLINEEYGFLDEASDIDTLVITAGFGRVAPFEELTGAEIKNLVKCNMLAAMHIIKHYYPVIKSEKTFYCAVMGSIAGHVASPLFSVYGAAKCGLCSFIENLNVELTHDGCRNRILDVSPGALAGTNFNGTGNNLSVILPFAQEVLERMYAREILYIPDYDEVYSGVIERYHADPVKYGCESYDYKISKGRMTTKPQVVVGYLSGTFDLFHIGHLNLLRRAKQQCDYLIVGVHKSGSWKGKETFIPFEERKEIVSNIKYVDRVIESFTEDSDAYDALHFNKLFVGSDYKGTERFRRYEEYFKGKDVEIVYFPYTAGTSSTQLRDKIKNTNTNK